MCVLPLYYSPISSSAFLSLGAIRVESGAKVALSVGFTAGVLIFILARMSFFGCGPAAGFDVG
jgi:hypothetical protein